MAALGYSQVSYPATVIFRVASTISKTLHDLRRHALGIQAMSQSPDADDSRLILDEALELANWQEIEKKHN
jgi:hypothetical protein